MYGRSNFKWVWGEWDHFGTLKTTNVPLSPTDPDVGTLPLGTLLDMDPTDMTEAVLATGNAVGFMTQDLDNEGLTGLQGFQNMHIGKVDNPALKPHPVTLRRPRVGAMIEVEGLGTANPGNLVCTSGTGSLSSGTTVGTELSVLNGCLRVAQSGDKVLFHLRRANLTPETDGNLRILVEAVGPYNKA